MQLQQRITAWLENTFLITQNDQITLNVSYVNATFNEFTYTDAWAGYQDYSDTVMPNAPKWSGTLGYTRYWIFSSGAQLSFEASSKLTQEYYVTFEKYRVDSLQPAYHKTDAYLTYNGADGKWRVSKWIKNIENEAVITYRSPSGLGLAEPRTYGVTFSTKF